MNQENSTPFDLKEIIEYKNDSVVSKTLINKKTGSITLFSFDQGQELSEHTAPFDAYVQVIDGEAEVSLAGKPYHLIAGQSIVMPADIPHAVKAIKQFKMMLVMIKS